MLLTGCQHLNPQTWLTSKNAECDVIRTAANSGTGCVLHLRDDRTGAEIKSSSGYTVRFQNEECKAIGDGEFIVPVAPGTKGDIELKTPSGKTIHRRGILFERWTELSVTLGISKLVPHRRSAGESLIHHSVLR